MISGQYVAGGSPAHGVECNLQPGLRWLASLLNGTPGYLMLGFISAVEVGSSCFLPPPFYVHMATLPTSVDPSAPVPSVDLDGTLGVTLIGLVLSTLLVHNQVHHSWGSQRFGTGCSGPRSSNCTSTTTSTPRIGFCTKSRSVPHPIPLAMFLN